MRSNPVLKTAAALAVLSFGAALAGSALAQTQPMPPEAAVPGDGGTDVTAPTPPPIVRYPDEMAAEAAQPAGIPTSSLTPVEQAYLLKAGDPTVVSNPPVPDTPATRRAYGGPDSNGGKQTRALGN
ncbi:hypothetical protein [Caulobacter sp. NIBR1757]|uniref:hypothetical protein n=1 Tax=Caulobacter sp. NIBR1757 TaxID=3016000 RepID=UPI0022F028F3|nr:hypothetical protein [Caulobacter sp. NIBR1757]WGM40094.1 hypothetical protein AMEJIAPC_03035 [Caulobacter sp. NIBR1757]